MVGPVAAGAAGCGALAEIERRAGGGAARGGRAARSAPSSRAAAARPGRWAGRWGRRRRTAAASAARSRRSPRAARPRRRAGPTRPPAARRPARRRPNGRRSGTRRPAGISGAGPRAGAGRSRSSSMRPFACRSCLLEPVDPEDQRRRLVLLLLRLPGTSAGGADCAVCGWRWKKSKPCAPAGAAALAARRGAMRARTFAASRARASEGAWHHGAAPQLPGAPFSTVTARRFCDQHEMSSQTATGRSLP